MMIPKYLNSDTFSTGSRLIMSGGFSVSTLLASVYSDTSSGSPSIAGGVEIEHTVGSVA